MPDHPMQPTEAAPPVHHRLDITRDICPMTFVKTKLELEEMPTGAILEVIIREGESLVNVARSCEEEGHPVVLRERHAPGIWRLLIRN